MPWEINRTIYISPLPLPPPLPLKNQLRNSRHISMLVSGTKCTHTQLLSLMHFLDIWKWKCYDVKLGIVLCSLFAFVLGVMKSSNISNISEMKIVFLSNKIHIFSVWNHGLISFQLMFPFNSKCTLLDQKI